jgi:hypothetical protein
MHTLKGTENIFFLPEQPIAKINDFWRWQGSDLLNNTMRGIFSEFIVATALGIDTAVRRADWTPYDLLYRENCRIEVKSSAYIQSWNQKKPSAPSFSIRTTREWTSETGYATTPQRNSDIYVFCLFSETDRQSANPLNLSSWDFWILPTTIINQTFGTQKTVSLNKIKPISIQTKYDGIKKAVDTVLLIK